MADKREFIRKIMAIAAKADSDFEGGESEKIETIAKLLEESEYAKSEDNDDVEEKETTDKCGKDEDDNEEKKVNTTEDEDEEEKKDAEDSDVVSASEVMAWLKTISEQLTALTSKSAAKDEDVDEEKKDAEDEDEEKKESEDEDEEKKDEEEKKTSEDSAVFVFGKTAQGAAEDPALKAYLA